jgi:aminopeptidase
MNIIYEKYAQVIVEYSLSLKPGEKVLVNSAYFAKDFLKVVYRRMLEAGAHPEMKISVPGLEKIFYDKAADEQLEYVSPTSRLVMDEYDAILNIRSPYNVKELQNVSAEKKQKVSMARTELNKTFMRRAASHELKWTLCVFPGEAGAQEAGMSLDEYEDFVYSACFLYDSDPIAKWRQLRDKQQKVVDFLNTKSHIRYHSPDVDVTFSTQGRTWLNSAGKNNMPSGEVFTAPVEDSVNGRVRFSYPGIFMGQEIEDITLDIKDGEVIGWTAKKGQELLDKVFDIPGTRRFGEVAVGMNHGITKFTRNMLFDEKIGGTIHMAIGAAYPETGGVNESSVHWDLLADMTDGGEIFADGEKIYENGKFII